MNLGRNASYEDYARIDETRYPRTPEKIAEYWLEKYKESSDDSSSLLYEDDNIKLVAKDKPVYCSGWDGDGDDDTPDRNWIVLEANLTIKNPNVTYKGEETPLYNSIKDGKYYLAVIFEQSYEYVETYHDSGSYWDPPESDGYYEPSGDPYIPDGGGPELFNTTEEAISAVKNCGKNDYMWDQKGVVTDDSGDSIFSSIGDIEDIYKWCDEAPISDPDGVYPAYHQEQMDIEAKIDELRGKY